ncbi:MAG: 1-acyl-sn-glycerol-3-phosphate acyltransferase [Holosporaceae bacterium]|jgi:1-acyl-sn-glycerol-3-phosphate acyltransferase|nr:1-acyl-sn-glycerol-3-phosphate acyltransferase [Holosporaceae bacterium]
MLILRSIIFNVIFYFVVSASLILASPLIFFKKEYAFIFWRYLSILLGFITEKIGGIKFTVENEHLIKNSAIYAIRHESTWETLILIQKFQKPIFVLKEELLKIPLFGIMSKKTGTVAIKRSEGVRSLMNALKAVKASLSEGHPVIIFPEGTRVVSGKYVPLKRGIALFYQKANCPVIPIIHNSGRFWPRRGFIKKPGTITLRILEPIAPGLSQEEFLEKLNAVFGEEVRRLKG